MKPKVTDQAEVAALRDFYEINGLMNIPDMNWVFTDNGHIEGDGLIINDGGHLSRLHVYNKNFKNSLNDKPKILDLRPLTGLVHLKGLKLWLGNTICNNLEPLTALTRLRYLKLFGIVFTDLAPLAKLIELDGLGMGCNDLHDLGPLSGLRGLRCLELTRTSAGDITPLANLTNLNRLDLSFNQITDLAPLAELPHLTRLNLTGNRIQNVEALTNLNSLTRLTLDLDSINDSSPLFKLVSLKKLSLYGIKIKNGFERNDLEKLILDLRVSDNLIVEVSFLVSNVFGYDVYALWARRPPSLEFRKGSELYRYNVRSRNPSKYKGKPPVDLDKDIREWMVLKVYEITCTFSNPGFNLPIRPFSPE
jgi:hypothetical protein